MALSARARVIDGKQAAAELRQQLRSAIAASGLPRTPGLRVVLVGDHPASRAYVRNKAKMAQEVGIDAALIERPASIDTAALLDLVETLNADPAVDGILVQLPLPSQVDTPAVLHAIDPAKDVDGLHPANVGRLFTAKRGEIERLLVPCTPYGCLLLLRSALGEHGLAGQHAVIIGRSDLVGKPLAGLLLLDDVTVTVTHSKTRDLPALCRAADIVIAAIGRAETVRGAWLKPGAVVIDVGINRVPGEDGKGRLIGDVAYEEAAQVVSALTPVPGGVGPMTVACLLRNTMLAQQRRWASSAPDPGRQKTSDAN